MVRILSFSTRGLGIEIPRMGKVFLRAVPQKGGHVTHENVAMTFLMKITKTSCICDILCLVSISAYYLRRSLVKDEKITTIDGTLCAFIIHKYR